MTELREGPIVVDAHQWFKNGDHPGDHPYRARPAVDEAEGLVVRYFRVPNGSGENCPECGREFFDHGWIDTREGGHRVCPGDWIITGVHGEHYPCKPDIFAATRFSLIFIFN